MKACTCARLTTPREYDGDHSGHQLGAAAFWIALAAVLIANGINGVRRERLRQETLLKLVEKTGRLDEHTVKTLFPAPPVHPHVFSAPPREPDGRRGLKIGGTIVLSVAAGLVLVAGVLLVIGVPATEDPVTLALAWAALCTGVGIGLIVSARFVRPPIDQRDRETS
jgi:hypothetical protein